MLCVLLLAICTVPSVYLFLSPEIGFVISYTQRIPISTDSVKRTIVTRSGCWCLIHVNVARNHETMKVSSQMVLPSGTPIYKGTSVAFLK